MTKFVQTTHDEYRRIARIQHSWMQRDVLFVREPNNQDTPQILNQIMSDLLEMFPLAERQGNFPYSCHLWVSLRDKAEIIRFKLIFC